MVENLTEILEPIANWFSSLGTPEIIVHWGHPFFMSIVIFVMGTFVALSGWQIRNAKETETEEVVKNKSDHRKVAPLMFIFLASGYTGGVLSLVMQHQTIFQSPHFWTGSLALLLLTINGVLSGTGFVGNKAALRTVHTYVGTFALIVLVLHTILGFKLGFSI